MIHQLNKDTYINKFCMRFSVTRAQISLGLLGFLILKEATTHFLSKCSMFSEGWLQFLKKKLMENSKITVLQTNLRDFSECSFLSMSIT